MEKKEFVLHLRASPQNLEVDWIARARNLKSKEAPRSLLA